ncbi:MAG: ABC transporter permease [Vicinamibacteria bacterium]|nr:ABC transporter permease [Vicinamibacteria bacterium]
MNDIRYSLRSLGRSKAFTAIAMLTLALCIGANSAIFSVVNAILLKPYPWPDSERLVFVYNTYPLMNLPNAGTSIPDYLDRKTGVAGFEDAAMYTNQAMNLASDGEPERIAGLRATPSLFSTLQSQARLGRVFGEAEAEPGNEKVVVLSHALWRDRFGADPAMVGKTIRLNSMPYQVIGVMPEDFYFPTPTVQAWVPFAFTADQRSDNERGNEFSTMVARLKPGASAAAIQRDLDLIQARNAERIAASRDFWKTSGFGGRMNGFLEQNVSNIRGMLWLIQAGVAAALLIGCANIASLLLARAMEREKELAIRSAMGAGRGRLMRLLIAESVLLFSGGGVLGVFFAWWCVRALDRLGLSNLPRGFAVELDLTVVAFTLACALGTGFLFGLLPAWSASRRDAAATLKEAGGRSGSGGRHTQMLRSGLVVSEVALAVLLLSTAGLLVRSFEALQRQNPGFEPGGLVTARVSLPANKYDTPEKRIAFTSALLERVRALPGVKSAGITTNLPFAGGNSSASYSSPDIVVPPGAPAPHARYRVVGSGYFETVGMKPLLGRLFNENDVLISQRVAIVDKLLADKYWPGQDPLGKRIVRDDPAKPFLVVGVVPPIKFQGLDEDVTKESIYYPFDQASNTNVFLAARASGDPLKIAPSLREAVRAVDPDQPVSDIKTMAERMDAASLSRRAPMILLGLFSGVALLLAVLGVYGVLAFAVTQRTPEFGVRMALGASRRSIAELVLRQGARLVAVGLTAGLALYLACSQLVGKLLYGIAATDLLSLSLAPIAIAIAALAACIVPVRRATGVSPLEALRVE